MLAPHVRTQTAKHLAKVHDIRAVSLRPNHYHGWPTLSRRRNGQLLLICTGGREGHVCPFGRTVMCISRDDGETWTSPRVVNDSLLDDRDAGIVALGGHTPGSTAFIVAARDRLWIFSGDTANRKANLLANRGKGFLYSYVLVPENTSRTEALRLWFSELDARPDITVIVSHDVDDVEASGMPRF